MKKIFIWSITAALAGFLFGFDTVVISGADKKLQALWQTSDAFHGAVVISMALWGTVIGAILGGFPTNRLGRKKTLIWIGVLYTVSAVGSALANDPITFAFFRFIGDRKSTRLNSSHVRISYAVFCLKKKKIDILR